MIHTHPIKYQKIHHLMSLPIITPPPTNLSLPGTAKKAPGKKDTEANSPSAITAKNSMTSPVTIKETVHGMTVCTFFPNLF